MLILIYVRTVFFRSRITVIMIQQHANCLLKCQNPIYIEQKKETENGIKIVHCPRCKSILIFSLSPRSPILFSFSFYFFALHISTTLTLLTYVSHISLLDPHLVDTEFRFVLKSMLIILHLILRADKWNNIQHGFQIEKLCSIHFREPNIKLIFFLSQN